MRTMIGLWLASLVVVAAVASAITLAQTSPGQSRVLSGNDIGFRVEGTNPKGEPVGALVIRLNGEWVEPGSTPTVRRAK